MGHTTIKTSDSNKYYISTSTFGGNELHQDPKSSDLYCKICCGHKVLIASHYEKV